jgi:hypothetical protein
MARHPAAPLEHLHHRRGEAHVAALPGQLVRNAVVVVLDLDVVVDVHRHRLPRRVLVSPRRQRPQRCSLHLLEETAPRARHLLEGPFVEPVQALGDGHVGLGEGEEGVLTQARQDPPFGEQHPCLHLGLVARLRRPRRDDHAPVVGGHLLVRPVDLRLVAVGPGHPRAQVVGHEDLGRTAEELEGADVGGDPVGQLL